MFRAEPYPTCSRTLPSPSPWGRGSGRVRLHVGYLGIPAIFQLVCHAFLSITFAFSGYSRSVEARNCRSNRKETGTQIGQIGKIENRIGYQIRKPFIFRENRNQRDGKSANRNDYQNRKTEVFWHKNRKTDLRNSQNQKSQCPPQWAVEQNGRLSFPPASLFFERRYDIFINAIFTFVHGVNTKGVPSSRSESAN